MGPLSTVGSVSAPADTTTTLRRMTRAQRREHFLDVAAELVVDTGIESVTMERVAANAGVSKALGYAYFDNSDELLAALFEREMAFLDQRVATGMAAAQSFEDRIRANLSAIFDTLAERGALVGTLLQVTPPDGSMDDRRKARDRSVEDFFTAMVESEYGLPRRAALVAANVYMAASLGAINLWIHRRASRRYLTDTFVTLVLGGIQALVAAEEASARS